MVLNSDAVDLAVASVLLLLLVAALVAVRRTGWYKRQVEADAALKAAAQAERQHLPKESPVEYATNLALGSIGCLLTAIVIGIVGLVALAVVVWAWRTVFGGG